MNECKHGHLARKCELCERDDRIAELERALKRIASNTCCDRCQEAALVAKEALND
jgi:hypothetical protein